MNRNVISVAFACVAVLVTVMAPLAAAEHKCTLATVTGTWGFTTTGSIPGVGPVAAVGEVTFDGSGNLSGSQTRSLNGAVADETFTGTITVNLDCTATEVIEVFQNGNLIRTSTLNVVIDDNGRAARSMITSIVLPDGTPLPSILTLDARRLFVSEK